MGGMERGPVSDEKVGLERKKIGDKMKRLCKDKNIECW